MKARLRDWLRRRCLPWRLAGCGSGVRLAQAIRVYHPERVWLGEGVSVDEGSYLIANTWRAVGLRLADHVRVGADCYLAATGGVIEVGERAVLGRGLVAYGNGGLVIGADAQLEEHVAISTINHRMGRTDIPIRAQGLELAPVVIGEQAHIGAGSVLLPGVNIGAGARVAPGSVVTRDVPAKARVGGVPARRIARCA